MWGNFDERKGGEITPVVGGLRAAHPWPLVRVCGFLPGVPADSAVGLRSVLRSREMGKVGYGRPTPGGVKSTPDPPRPPFRWWRGCGSGASSTARSFIPSSTIC
jgi:hypothetical protein